MAIDLVKAGQQCLGEEAADFQGSLVYLDEGAVKAVYFLGGLPFLVQIGARAVCQLENAAACDEAVVWDGSVEVLAKIVIITSQLLSNSHRSILRCIRTHSKIRNFVIFSSVSQDAHSGCGDTPLGTDAFTEYKDLLLQDILKDSSTPDEVPDPASSPSITVKHLPMLCCALTPKLFVFPSAAAFATAPLSSKRESSFLSPGLPAYDNGLAWDEDEILPSGATLHAHFLHHLAAQLDLKFDIFSLGPLAHFIGKQLTDISSLGDGFGRARKTAGLLLLDRTLDLITPTSHGDSFVDKVYSFLPRRKIQESSAPVKRPSIEVRVPPLEEEKSSNLFQIDELDPVEVTGSIWDFPGSDRIDVLFEKKTKDGALFLRKLIQDVLRDEQVEVSGRSRLTTNAAELRSLATTLFNSRSIGLKESGLVQLGKVAAEVLSPSRSTQWDAFASAERVLGITVADGVEVLASQLGDLIRQTTTSGSSVFSLRDVLTIVVYGYALAGEYSTSRDGPFSWEEERSLKEALIDAILKGSIDPPLGFLDGLETATKVTTSQEQVANPDSWSEDQWENWDDNNDQQEYSEMQLKLELTDRVHEVFDVLRKVAAARMHYPLRENRLVAGSNRGLISEVMSLVLANSEIPGLKHHSSTVGRFLKSGLGRFGLGQAKHRLSDNKVLLVFVIGGFNAVEVREARALKGDFDELLIGGTTLLTPDVMYQLLLGSIHA